MDVPGPSTAARELSALCHWLIRHPIEYQMLLTAVQIEEEGLDDEGLPPYPPAVCEDGRLARLFLLAATFALCLDCYHPTVFLPDGRRRDWPSLDEHLHEPGRARAIPHRPPRLSLTGAGSPSSIYEGEFRADPP